jgi:hypothetical protein
VELSPFVFIQVVDFKELAGTQPDLSLSPVAFFEHLAALFDGVELGAARLDDAFNELLMLIRRPILALLDIEVLEVEVPIVLNNVGLI